jgi:argininosuccinate lyase
MVDASNAVVLLGYDGFGSINALARVVRSNGFEPVAVVNRGCNQRHTSACAEVLYCDDVFRTTSVLQRIHDRFKVLRFAGLCCAFDVLMHVYLELVQTHLDVPRPDTLPIRRCRVKPALRKLLKGSPYDVPCCVVRKGDDGSGAGGEVGFPCIAKPVAGAGSLGVRRCETAASLQTYVKELRARLARLAPYVAPPVVVDGIAYDPGCDVLVERELLGPELTCDGYVHDGKFALLLSQDIIETRSDREFLDVGFITPPVRVDADRLQAVERMLEYTLRILGCSDFVFHAEVKFTKDGPRVVEINPRPGGGPIARIFERRTGCSPFEFFLKVSRGDRTGWVPPGPVPGPDFIGYYTLFADRHARLARITGMDRLTELSNLLEPPIVVLEPGESLPSFIDKMYLAFVLLKGESPTDIEEALRGVASRLGFVLDGKTRSDVA